MNSNENDSFYTDEFDENYDLNNAGREFLTEENVLYNENDLNTTASEGFQTEENASYNSNVINDDIDQPSTSNQNALIANQNDRDERIVLSIIWDKSKIGAAFFNLETFQLSVLPDIIDCSFYFRITKGLYSQIRPYKIVTVNKTADKFIKELLTLINDPRNPDSLSDTNPSCRLQIFSRKTHSFETCKKKVLNLQLATEPQNASAEERQIYLQTVLDFSCEIMIHSLGVLLMFLDKYWGLLVPNAQTKTPKFYCMNRVSLNNFLFMDDDTYKALQITDPEFSIQYTKGIGGTDKQTPSLFGLYKNCRTLLGTRKMRDYFIHPTNDKNIIHSRHKVISFFLDVNNEDIKQGVYESLHNISNLNPIFKKMVGSTGKTFHWKTFYQTLRGCVEICDLLRQYSTLAPLFRDIVTMYNELNTIANCIFELIDVSRENYVGVKFGIDLELDAKKHAFKTFENVVNITVNHEFQKLPDFIKECKIFYIKEIGYILKVRKWKDHLTIADINSLGFKLLFCAPNHVTYKSPLCVELDRKFGAIHKEIMSHEVRVIVRLVQYIEKHFAKIQYCLNMIAELDCLMSMAHLAFELNLICPEITEENTIEIIDGRHPLIEIISNSYVPNNYTSKQNYGKVKIITGPNSSGKSVYMKQVALICFMVHIGSFVPATSVKMGLLDNIFSCSKALESVSNGISNFLIDLRQMSHAMNGSNSKTLIIIDEFGVGTTENDGASLLTASITAFVDQGYNCPHILISTHFNQISSILPLCPQIQYLKTKLTFDTDDNVIYLYKVTEGQNTDSYAISVAQKEGLDSEIIERMKQIKLCFEGKAPMPPCEAKSFIKLPMEPKGFFDNLICSKDIHTFDHKEIASELNKDNNK